MTRFKGKIGYAIEKETYPGVWETQLVERPYTGDVIKDKTKILQSSSVNGTVSINHSFSVVGDVYAFENIFNIRSIQYLGKRFQVTDVVVEKPRLILSIGGLYVE